MASPLVVDLGETNQELHAAPTVETWVGSVNMVPRRADRYVIIDLMARRRVLVVITIAYVALVCLITLTPQPVDAGSDGVVDRLIAAILDWADRSVATAWLDYGRLEKLANVGMFVPIGLLLVLLAGRGRWWLGIVAGCAFTLFVEGMQATVLAATRFATVSDLVANSVGAAVGTALAVLLLTIAGRSASVQSEAVDSIER